MPAALLNRRSASRCPAGRARPHPHLHRRRRVGGPVSPRAAYARDAVPRASGCGGAAAGVGRARGCRRGRRARAGATCFFGRAHQST
eukprot:363504-Chlamydomonas_euryale.AAC.2